MTRIATYNVEWFNTLFDGDGTLIHDNSWSSRWDITKAQQGDAVAKVVQAVDADLMMIIEAPDSSRHRDTVYALEGFAAHHGLRQRSAAMGFSNHTQQEIALLYDPDKVTVEHRPMDHPNAPMFDDTLSIDLDVDDKGDAVTWSKPPFEAWVTPKSGPAMMLIGVHAKSKAPHGAKNEQHAMQISIENRRKQLAQCIWLRRRVDHLLAASVPTIVLGDFNDGPGLDKYEALFGRSGVEIVLGEGDRTALYDPHAAAALSNRFACPTTARFWLSREKRYLQALLDYVMVSPELVARAPDWRIWHPFDDAQVYANKDLSTALLQASDHFPVSLDLPD